MGVCVGELVGVADGVNVPVGVFVGVRVLVGVIVGDNVPVGVLVGVRVFVGVMVLVGVLVGDEVGVGVQATEQVSFQVSQPLLQDLDPVPHVVTEHAPQVVPPGTHAGALSCSLALGSGASASENHLS